MASMAFAWEKGTQLSMVGSADCAGGMRLGPRRPVQLEAPSALVVWTARGIAGGMTGALLLFNWVPRQGSPTRDSAQVRARQGKLGGFGKAQKVPFG